MVLTAGCKKQIVVWMIKPTLLLESNNVLDQENEFQTRRTAETRLHSQCSKWRLKETQCISRELKLLCAVGRESKLTCLVFNTGPENQSDPIDTCQPFQVLSSLESALLQA